MQINKISQIMQGELRKVDGSRKPELEKPAIRSSAADRAELSDDGKNQREIEGDKRLVSSVINALPDERAEKVAEARMKISAGFYNTDSFAEKLAEKLVNTLA